MCYNAWIALKGGVTPARHANSILEGVVDGVQGWVGERGEGVVFSFDWDEVPDLRPNTVLYNAILSAYVIMKVLNKMEASRKDVESRPSKSEI